MTITGERIRAWLCESALPLWSSAGLDSGAGGFFDDLSAAGDPLQSAPKRLRVQARQVYVFSHAHLLGWTPAPGQVSPLDAATSGFDFMAAHYWREDPGGFVYAVDRDGAVTDPRVELYEQAFALFACAWYFRASGDERAKTAADRLLGVLDAHLADKTEGGYFENLSHDLPRRQNPHMHLLEALLALHHATGSDVAAARARDLVDLFRRRLFDQDTGTLGEFFDTAWRPMDGTVGQIVEPGHHYEWTWLLHHYGAATGDDCGREAELLYRFAEQHGIDRGPGPTEGLVYDSVLRRGVDLDDNKRLWGQTEAIKAQTARLEFTGDTEARARLDTLLDRLFECHLVGETGLWREHLQRDGTPIRETVPATSFYHLFLALTEVLRVRDGVMSL
ncbi:MAG: mannose/cellobiose epimerase-like protein (N-acyl-D-glucosamine 2-epimerase family) [Alphaproteobacteria bacterium]